jgi:hypothetical protein
MTTHPIWSAAALVLGLASPALPCTVAGPLPTPHSLVKSAAVIVHARVEGLAEAAARSTICWPGHRDSSSFVSWRFSRENSSVIE